MRAALNVSRSGYYKWLKGKDAHIRWHDQKEQRDLIDLGLIKKAYLFRGYDKGVRGIYMRLKHEGVVMNQKKIRRLMRKYGLYCPIRKANPYRRMAKALRTNAVADNSVKREFKVHGARAILLTDITYIPIGHDFCYLSVIIDAYTMQVLAHKLSESLEVAFVLETVDQLIREHGASINDKTYIHSDQGCHYTSVQFRELIGNYGLIQSMSRRGNCWDNAPQESFFGHMKDEIKDKMKKWRTFHDASDTIEDWIDYYNKDRYQMGLMQLSPNEFYDYKIKGIYPSLMKV